MILLNHSNLTAVRKTYSYL